MQRHLARRDNEGQSVLNWKHHCLKKYLPCALLLLRTVCLRRMVVHGVRSVTCEFQIQGGGLFLGGTLCRSLPLRLGSAALVPSPSRPASPREKPVLARKLPLLALPVLMAQTQTRDLARLSCVLHLGQRARHGHDKATPDNPHTTHPPPHTPPETQPPAPGSTQPEPTPPPEPPANPARPKTKQETAMPATRTVTCRLGATPCVV